jgi:hypothetical protein
MGSHTRLLPSFSGSDIEYISLLEKLLLALEFHHRNCPLQLIPPTTTAAKRRRIETLEISTELSSLQPKSPLSTPAASLFLTSSDGASCTQSLTASSSHASNDHQSGSSNPPKKFRTEPWKKPADALIKTTPVAQEWKIPWITNDRGSSNECHSLTNLILGTSFPNTISGDVETGFQDEVLARAANFAHSIRYYDDTADLCSKIRCFQEIVLASICVVLLDCGRPRKDVDAIMQIHIVDGVSKHLHRLRNGAKWANSLVNELHWRGWANRAQELLFLCRSLKVIFDCTISY